MKSASILLVLAVITGAACGAQEGGCGRAGALRCDADGRHLSACTQGGAWRRVLDCGASHGACVDGRCVGGASARAGNCTTPGVWGCSSNCEYKTICTSNNVWTEVSSCPDGYICDCGECVNEATNTCRYSNSPICGQGSAEQQFPDVNNCSNVYYCSREGDRAVGVKKCTTEPDYYYQPCKRTCGSLSTFCDHYKSCNGNEGLDAVIPGNPSLHYICANGTMFLMKCTSNTAIYDPLVGECFEVGLDYCPGNGGLDVRSFFKIDPFDECTSLDGSTTSTDGATTPSGPCSVGDKWADPGNVCKFYYCYPPGEPISITCPPNSKYDAAKETCVSASGSCLR